MRTKKAILNFIFDALPQLIISLIGFVRIKIILDVLGNDTLGVYQLFGQLLAYVSLAELGLTGAVTYILYRPIHEKDQKKINGILSGARSVFNIIACVMLVIGLILMFNIGFFIKSTSLSFSTIKIWFLLMVIANMVTYFVVPHVLLFDAEQNKYRYARYTQTILVIKAILEIFIIFIFKDILYLLILNVGFAILQNILVIYLSKKEHPALNLKEKKDFSFWKKTKDLIPHKIGMLIAYNIDIIIVSKILGLVEVVAYTSYMYIVNTLINIIGKISTATVSGIGNLLIENKKKAFDSFLEYNSFVFFLASAICVPLLMVITPFIELWYGAKYTVSGITGFLFVFLVFYSIIRNVLNIFGNAAGLFKETLICVYLEIILNLSLSLILVNYIGITGVLLSTTIAYIVSEYLIKPFILNKHIFNCDIRKYYFDCLKYTIIVGANIFIFNKIFSNIKYTGLFNWFLYGFIIFIANLFILTIYYAIIKKNKFMARIIPKKFRRKNLC